MVIVETAVWIDHLRAGVPAPAALLEGGQVLIHPFIIGEIACAQLENRAEVLRLLHGLPRSVSAKDREVLQFIELRRLMGRRIGYMDASLLTATMLSGAARLWTRDQGRRIRTMLRSTRGGSRCRRCG